MGVGLIPVISAVLLANEGKGLLIGEGAHPSTLKTIRQMVEADPRRCGCRSPPHHVLRSRNCFALDILFRRSLSANDVTQAVDRMEKAVRAAHLSGSGWANRSRSRQSGVRDKAIGVWRGELKSSFVITEVATQKLQKEALANGCSPCQTQSQETQGLTRRAGAQDRRATSETSFKGLNVNKRHRKPDEIYGDTSIPHSARQE